MDDHVVGTATRVPVRNIWLLYLYASEIAPVLTSAERIELEAMPERLVEVVTRILVSEARERLRTGLNATYRERTDVLSHVRGRTRVLDTARKQLLSKGAVACEFDDYVVDTDLNRYVLSALTRSARLVADRDTSLSIDCRSLAGRFRRAGVQDGGSGVYTGPDGTLTARPRREDRRLVAAAQMVLTHHLPSVTEGTTAVRQVDMLRDQRLRKLYESAVLGFCKVEYPRMHPRSEGMKWSAAVTPGSLWPRMKTDITLTTRGGHRVIIDTKFAAVTKPAPVSGAMKLKSKHLYQIQSYISTQEASGLPQWESACGLLLYPQIPGHPAVKEWLRVGSHVIGAATVDLAGPSEGIGQRLRDLISEAEGHADFIQPDQVSASRDHLNG